MEEAGVRRHGTTGEAPISRFEIERAVLLPLPAVAPDLGVWSQAHVHPDCHLQFERAYYSVPFSLVGKLLWFKATDGMVTIYHDFKPVAAHGRTRKHGDRRTVNDHLPPDAQAFFAHDRAWCLEQAGRIGPACAELIARLLSDRIVERLRAAQGVLRLQKSYAPARLEAACARALAHESPYYRTVKTILAGGHDLRSDDWAAILGAAPALIAKLAVGGFALALIETVSAKMRIFRAPEFLGTAFLLAVLAMLVNLLLGS